MTPPVLTQLVAAMGSIMGIEPVPAQGTPGKGSLTLNPSNSSSTLKVSDSFGELIHPGPAPASSLPSWMDLPPHLRDGSEGLSRLRRLSFNARYLARALQKLGFITYGHPSSPIVPLLIFNPGKLPMFHRLMVNRATPIVVVVVAYPATPLVSGRVRFCVSAAHTKEDIDTVIEACDEIGDVLDLKHGKGERWPLQEIMARSVELAHL